MSAPTDLLRMNLPKLLPLGRTLIRSRIEAVSALSAAATLVWAVLQLTGLLWLSTLEVGPVESMQPSSGLSQEALEFPVRDRSVAGQKRQSLIASHRACTVSSVAPTAG